MTEESTLGEVLEEAISADSADGEDFAETPETPPEGDEGAEAVVEPLDAPEHWDLEHQEKFRSWPRDAQEAYLERSKAMEAAHTKRSQEIAPVRKAVEQWQPYFDQIGVAPEHAIGTLVQTEYALRTGSNAQKQQILFQLAQDYGVQFDAPAPAPTPEEDPFGVRALVDSTYGSRFSALERQIEALGGHLGAQRAAAQQASAAQAQAQIDSFVAEVGADGKPAHPYFAEVESEMTSLAQAKASAGERVDLAELYEQACWLSKSVRNKIQAAERHSADLKRREEVSKRKGATGGITGGGGAGKEQPETIREALRAAMAESQVS